MENGERLSRIIKFNISNNFEGYDKFDGSNNYFSLKLFPHNKWITFFFQQLVKESPIDLRPVLGIKKTQNVKGNALFISSLIRFYNLTNNKLYLDEAKKLLKIQIGYSSKEFKTLAWGHNFVWQGLRFRLPRNYPNITNTIFTAEAIMDLYEITKDNKLLEYLESIKDSILNIFPVVYNQNDSLAISYFPFKSYPVCINIQAFTSAFLAKYYSIINDSGIKEFSKKLMNFVVYSMNKDYSWYYSYPQKNFYFKKDLPDNYHTAFILVSLLDYYKALKDDTIMEIFNKALDYYEKNLFGDDGSPKWKTGSAYPQDIHSSASAILAFSRASEIQRSNLNMAEKILSWTSKKMYNSRKNYFIYRRGRIMNSNYRLVRWSDAWMCLALSEYLNIKRKYEKK